MERQQSDENSAAAAAEPAASAAAAAERGVTFSEPLAADFEETGAAKPKTCKFSWPSASPVQPLNFFEVLRRQHGPQGTTYESSSSNEVYIHLNVNLHYSQRRSVLQQVLSPTFSSSPSGEGDEQIEEQQLMLRLVEDEAAAEAAAGEGETGPGCLYRLEDLYLCEPCGKVLSPLEVKDEVECHTCVGCLDVLPPAEAAACGFRCSKCFSCPRCKHSLSLSRKKRVDGSASASPRQGGPPSAEMEGIYLFAGDEEDSFSIADRFAEAVAAAEDAAAAAAAAGYTPLLEGQAAAEAAAAAAAAEGEAAVVSAWNGGAAEVESHLEETGGFAVSGAPQRCDSLLSVRSLDGAADEEEEEEAAAAAAACCSRKHLYFYTCAHCKWSSEPAGVSSPVPAALPLIAMQAERHQLGCLLFGDLLQVLQLNAYERERRRQLQRKVKNRAVAALLAAVSSSSTHKGLLAAAGTPWKLSDAQAAETERERRLKEFDIWSYMRPDQWTFAAPRASLAAVAQGAHLRCSVKETLASAAAAAAQTDKAAAEAAAVGDRASVSSSSVSTFARSFPAFTQPLHAEQLQIDKGHPDVSPVYSTALVVAASRHLALRDRVGLQQLLECPEAYAAAATGMRFLLLKRKCLLPRRSRRCSFCGRFVVKAHLVPDAVSSFKINHAAALFLPHMECCVGGQAGCLLQGQKAFVFFTLSSYADIPVFIQILSATNGLRERQKQQQQQQQQEQEQQEGDWWNVDWGGSLSVDLGPYDEVLDELGGQKGGEQSDLSDKIVSEGGDAVLAQSGNGALLKLEVYVHPNSSDRPAVLPFAAEVTLGGEGAGPSFKINYVAFLGRVGKKEAVFSMKRMETV